MPQSESELLLTPYQTRLLRRFFITYYDECGRDFPWRAPQTTPFQLLIAEMLLRQTRADQVVPCWQELVARASTATELLEVLPAELHRIIAPLGLANQRTVSLIDCSSALMQIYSGEVPRAPEELATLPHVGTYAANAVACFAFDTRLPIVDGNVLRVFSRLINVDLGRDNRRSPRAIKMAWQILPRKMFREHNWGLLDFAAAICTSRAPAHGECGLRRSCGCYQKSTC